ncbi:MAG TPA: phosphatase PAP2 family protein [Bacteroidota bacterium]|nr:phosphatase PAP2 family protein [Bacteroidota bacterium]
MSLRGVTARLHAADVLIIAFLLFLALVTLAFRVPHWWLIVLINCAAVAAICVLAWARVATGSPLLAVVHDWHVAPTMFFAFKELYFIIGPLHGGRDYDDVLIAADRWLFGVDPTRWLMQFSTPWLTEILQIAYTLFYLLFLAIGFELYRRERKDEYHLFMFTCVYGFALSYCGYFLLPAVGPRFTLHDFSALDRDLPGLLLTPYLRRFVNYGGSVPMGVPNAEAIALTQRDVFPSGHTMMTLVVIVLGFRFRLRLRYPVLATGILLIIATVYERYHYVVDLLGGAAFMLLCVLTADRLYRACTAAFGTTASQGPPPRGT